MRLSSILPFGRGSKYFILYWGHQGRGGTWLDVGQGQQKIWGKVGTTKEDQGWTYQEDKATRKENWGTILSRNSRLEITILVSWEGGQ